MKLPVVSVIMSVNKDRGNLQRSIDSVLDQTYQDFEFIIIDDASPDDELTKLKQIAGNDHRLKIYTNSNNLGLTKSLNKGVKKAQGTYIARIDEGDLWKPEKLERQVDFLETHPDYVLVGCRYNTYSDEEGAHSPTKLPGNDKEIRKWLVKGLTPFTHPAILFRNQINYNVDATTSQDFELYLRLYFEGKLYNLKDELVSILISKKSITRKFESVQFYNHFNMHQMFLKHYLNNNGNSISESFGCLNYDNILKKQQFRLWYMERILSILENLKRRSFMRRVLKNILIPDILIYNVKRKLYAWKEIV